MYPWQQSLWQQVQSQWQTLPHAILLNGQQGTGKLAFAKHIAQALFCEHPQADKQACGACSACHLFVTGHHPDLLLVTPETDADNARKLAQIKVDAIRAVLAFAQLSSHQGGRRVIILEPAESLNTQAANALLKVLEEPPANVVFLLVSHHRERLLPTILSRVQQWFVPTPTWEQTQAYVATAMEGTPLSAAQLAFQAGSPLLQEDAAVAALREQWLGILSQPRLLNLMDFASEYDKQKRPLSEALAWLYKWLVDLGLSQAGQPAVYYPNYQTQLNQLAHHSPYLWQQLVNKLHKLIPFGQHTLNVKLQLEDLSIDYLNLITRKKAA